MILIFYLLQDVVSSLLISNLIFLHYVVTTPAVFFVLLVNKVALRWCTCQSYSSLRNF